MEMCYMIPLTGIDAIKDAKLVDTFTNNFSFTIMYVLLLLSLSVWV